LPEDNISIFSKYFVASVLSEQEDKHFLSVLLPVYCQI